MKDEEYIFHSECREKKNIARSARNKRTHNGKSGRVKLPSDYMTKKELKAMNGEVKSYRLNQPMSWSEFIKMPDDIKVDYIKLLRQKYDVPDTYLAKMFGVSQAAAYKIITRLGISIGRTRSGRTHWDKEGFLAWCNGVTVEPKEIAEEVVEPVDEAVETVEHEKTESSDFTYEKKRAIPNVGNMVFEGKVEEILATVGLLLGGANVHINITWDVLDE